MPDTKPLEKREIDAIRGFTQRVGTAAAAEALGVHRSAITNLLSGVAEVRPNTIEIMRSRIADGALVSSPPEPRAEARPAKVRA